MLRGSVGFDGAKPQAAKLLAFGGTMRYSEGALSGANPSTFDEKTKRNRLRKITPAGATLRREWFFEAFCVGANMMADRMKQRATYRSMTRILNLAALSLLLAAGPAAAQLPVATGRQISMSNPAWKIFIPSTYQQRAGNVADLLVHFHGDPQTVWNNAKYAELNTVIVTVNYSGLSSAYSTPFSNAALFQALLDEALAKVRAVSDIPDTLQWDKLGVSSFSAGYGAVREILKSATYRNNIDVLLAADSLYATTAGDGTPLDSQMVDYKTFASLAKNGTKTFLFSHSLVPTFTYESTQETGDELLQHLGISASAINTNGLGTLHFYRHAKSGNFELWGATGSDGDAHLAHLRYIGEFFEDLPLAKIPEPSTLALAAFAGLAAPRSRKRRAASFVSD
jgi:hypothetical protein